MSLNFVFLVLKFLAISIYLVYWFDSIRKTAKRLIERLVFELKRKRKLPKLFWLKSSSDIGRLEVETLSIRNNQTWEWKERRGGDVGINGCYRRRGHHTSHFVFLSLGHKT
jgi:hypothetical protein